MMKCGRCTDLEIMSTGVGAKALRHFFAKFSVFSTDLPGILFLCITEHFGFVDRVHVPCIALTRMTYQFFRLEFRNTEVKNHLKVIIRRVTWNT